MLSDSVALVADSRTEVCLCFDRSRCEMESRLRVEDSSRSTLVGSTGSAQAVTKSMLERRPVLDSRGR